MAFICYRQHRFKPEARLLIDHAIRIIEDYRTKGFPDMTLRQLYYQFISHDLFREDQRYSWTGMKWVHDPNGTKNAMPNYKCLVGLISEARMGGYIDWTAIMDRTRNLVRPSVWNDPMDIINSAAKGYRENLWAEQPEYVEVWVEKDALLNVVDRACDEYRAPYFSCRGYTSLSEMWQAAMRLKRKRDEGFNVFVIHLGDHDPSGKDMTRDVEDRLAELSDGIIEIHRLALNMDQIEEFDPPPSPAKTTDSRSQAYIDEFGNDSWELDALDLVTLNDLIQGEIKLHLDMTKWVMSKEVEERHREELQKISTNFEKVRRYVNKLKNK